MQDVIGHSTQVHPYKKNFQQDAVIINLDIGLPVVELSNLVGFLCYCQTPYFISTEGRVLRNYSASLKFIDFFIQSWTPVNRLKAKVLDNML